MKLETRITWKNQSFVNWRSKIDLPIGLSNNSHVLHKMYAKKFDQFLKQWKVYSIKLKRWWAFKKLEKFELLLFTLFHVSNFKVRTFCLIFLSFHRLFYPVTIKMFDKPSAHILNFLSSFYVFATISRLPETEKKLKKCFPSFT